MNLASNLEQRADFNATLYDVLGYYYTKGTFLGEVCFFLHKETNFAFLSIKLHPVVGRPLASRAKGSLKGGFTICTNLQPHTFTSL